MHQDKAVDTVSDPASRNVEHWSNSSRSDIRLEGSAERLDLTAWMLARNHGECNQ